MDIVLKGNFEAAVIEGPFAFNRYMLNKAFYGRRNVSRYAETR